MITRTCAAGVLLAALSIYGCAASNKPTASAASGPSAPLSCLTATGSHISPGDDSKCIGWGRSYSQTDIQRTGKDTVAGALRNLDPSLTITH